MHSGQIPNHAVHTFLILLAEQSKCIHQIDLGCGWHEDQRLSEGINTMSLDCRFHVMLTQHYCIPIQYIL